MHTQTIPFKFETGLTRTSMQRTIGIAASLFAKSLGETIQELFA